MTNEQLFMAIGIPILFNAVGFLLLNSRIGDANKKIDTLDRDLREWAKIIMQHNTDIARLKDKTGLS